MLKNEKLITTLSFIMVLILALDTIFVFFNNHMWPILNVSTFGATKLSASFLIIIPKITGTVTINTILRAIPVIEMFCEIFTIPNKSADVKIIKGTEKILIKLIISVSDIERATSQLANLVSMFDVTPPGAAAIIITPRASSKGVLNILIRINAITGSRMS